MTKTDQMKPPYDRRIYVNRNLRLDTVKAIGFDMDYTLARYYRQPIESLAYKLTAENLVKCGYPKEVTELPYDPDFVLRGLTVDKLNGNILKLDRHRHPCRVYNGYSSLDKNEKRETYRREKIHFHPPRFAFVDTLFSLPEVSLYANTLQLLKQQSDRIDTWRLYDDIRAAIDEVHRDNSLKSRILADVGTFIERDPLLARTLHKLRSANKKVFLLTNSFWPYTKAVMHYLLDGEISEYSDWTQYFDIIGVGAAKPSFFSEDAPFLRLNQDGEVIERDAHTLQQGEIYQGGSSKVFEQATRLSAEEILYVGDHIYGDILNSKKHAAWRTALIVEELEDEIAHSQEHQQTLQKLNALEIIRRELDDEANSQRRNLTSLEAQYGKDSAEYESQRKQRDATKAKLKQTLTEINTLNAKIDHSFNRYWGMVLKEGGDNTRFAEQVQENACIYTSRASNFYYYSAYQYFRAARDVLPHERLEN